VTPDADILDVYRSFQHETGHDAFPCLAFTCEHGTGTSFITFALNQVAEPWRFSDGMAIPCRETGDVLVSFIQRGNHAHDTCACADEWVTAHP
jgi:hypothetical protein